MAIYVGVYFWLFFSIELYVWFYASIILLITVALKSWPMMPPTFFFPKIALAICVFLWLQRSCGIVCSVSVKTAIRILIGIALNMKIAFVIMNILTVLILPAHEPRLCLHLFVSYSFFYQCCTVFSLYIFDLVVKFIPRWFILFHVILFFKYS